jgi:hypothetical protein
VRERMFRAPETGILDVKKPGRTGFLIKSKFN